MGKRASLGAQVIKNLLANAGDLSFLGSRRSLKTGMETHPSILAWRIPWTEEPGSPWGGKELDTNERLTHTHKGFEQISHQIRYMTDR